MKCDSCFHKKICTHYLGIKDGTYGAMRYDFDTETCGDYVAADVAPVVHGYNDNLEYSEYDEFRCSVCGVHLEDWNSYYNDRGGMFDFCFNYCPNCGAKMDGDKNANT